jgi:hypothetical protein
VAQESVIELDQPLEGIVRVDLEVQREGPLKKEPAAGDSPAAGGGLQQTTPTSTGAEGAPNGEAQVGEEPM